MGRQFFDPQEHVSPSIRRCSRGSLTTMHGWCARFRPRPQEASLLDDRGHAGRWVHIAKLLCFCPFTASDSRRLRWLYNGVTPPLVNDGFHYGMGMSSESNQKPLRWKDASQSLAIRMIKPFVGLKLQEHSECYRPPGVGITHLRSLRMNSWYGRHLAKYCQRCE